MNFVSISPTPMVTFTYCFSCYYYYFLAYYFCLINCNEFYPVKRVPCNKNIKVLLSNVISKLQLNHGLRYTVL